MIATLRQLALRLMRLRMATGEAWFLLTMTLIGCFGIAASTIYVPLVPAIAAELGARLAGVQLTFAFYLVIFALGMPVVGPMSDRCGRRRVLFTGLAFSIIGSALCAASPSLSILITGRAIQAVGACAGLVVGRAVIRDRYSREEAARVIAGLSFTITLAQALAPVAGSYLGGWGGWRAGFVAVALVAGIALLLGIRHLPDRTQSPSDPVAESRNYLAAYRALITAPNFLAYTLAATGASAGFQLFSAGGAAVLVSGFGMSAQSFAFMAVLPPAGFLVGSVLVRRLTPRLGLDGTIACGTVVLGAAAATMLGLALGHIATPLAVVAPMIFLCCGSGLLTPNAVAGALSIKPEIGGAASGFLSFTQLGGAAAATCLLSRLDNHSSLALSGVIALAVAIGIGGYGLLRLGHIANAAASKSLALPSP